jgi:multicomponent K+:H+ antiporter subunit D
MSHGIIFPVLLPSFAAVLLLFAVRRPLAVQRALGLAATAALFGVALRLLARAATGEREVYRLGDWPAPFGIVLVLDRLSALMVLLTAGVALVALVAAARGWDGRGRHFHALFQFQLMGLTGAFLTGDIFNLFVFFEILLIASYGLLVHGGGADRLRSGFRYVILNLTASSLFLLALGIVYGTTGTLNLADLAVKVGALGGDEATLLRAGALLLLVVFAVKAAALPLYFWLPGAYAAASAPVAALFALLTKVGIYAILRVFVLVFGARAGELAGLALPVLVPVGLATLAAATLGVLAARELGRLVAYLVIVSIGTLLVAAGLGSEPATAAGLFYLLHSTLVAAGLFLLVERIAEQRGGVGDGLRPGPAVAQPGALGTLFCVGAMAAAGLPPLSGFFGKLFVLRSALGAPAAGWIFAVVLASSLLLIAALARAGSELFWRAEPALGAPVARPATAADLLPAAALLAASALLVAAAGPVWSYAEATAAQLADVEAYVRAVLGVPWSGAR